VVYLFSIRSFDTVSEACENLIFVSVSIALSGIFEQLQGIYT